MKQYFPIDVALDDDLFYSYRLSMGIFDSLISKDEEEKIKRALQNKKLSKNNDFDSYRQEFLKKINLTENDMALELFTDTNDFLSSIGKLENEYIHLLFQFSEIITSNVDSKIICGNELVLHHGTYESSEYMISPISQNIIGFVDYIDTRSDTIVNYISKFKKIYDPSLFLDNKQKSHKDDVIYIKLLLRVSFIKSVSLFKMYGKIFPIYLFDGNQLLIKIEPILNPSNEGCIIYYKVITDQIDIPSVKVDLNYYQFKWFHSWRNTHQIPTCCYSFQNIHPPQLSLNKKICIQKIKNCESTTTSLKKATQVVNECPKDDFMSEKLDEKSSSQSKDREVHNTSSDEENCEIPEVCNEDNHISSHFSKTTNDVINELLNKPNSNSQVHKEKKKRFKKSKSFDMKNSQDYVDKLIKQQTMQLFNL